MNEMTDLTESKVSLSNLTASTAGGGGPWRHPWCQPGDEPHRVFVLRFCDPDVREMIFQGEDGEAEAWAAWEKYSPSWNVYLFATLPRAEALALPQHRTSSDGEGA
jgi:hypothetical protein